MAGRVGAIHALGSGSGCDRGGVRQFHRPVQSWIVAVAGHHGRGRRVWHANAPPQRHRNRRGPHQHQHRDGIRFALLLAETLDGTSTAQVYIWI